MIVYVIVGVCLGHTVVAGVFTNKKEAEERLLSMSVSWAWKYTLHEEPVI